jgi:hypothetical protein
MDLCLPSNLLNDCKPKRLGPDLDIPELGDRDWFRTGSSVICFPPVEDTDIDIVVVFDNELHETLETAGYDNSSRNEELDYANNAVILCYRKGVYNIIAVPDKRSYDLWRTYTQLAALMRLNNKHDRVTLAQFITEGAVRGTCISWDVTSSST